MGYTHYWDILDAGKWAAAFPLIVHDTYIIICQSGVPIGGPRTELVPIVSETEGIALNGAGDGHEPFILIPDVRNVGLDRKGRPKYQRSCKTARMPYDMVVTAILIRAKKHAGDALSVTSDGLWDEWGDARDLLEGIWGEEDLVCPFDERESEEDEYELESDGEDDTESEGTEIDDAGEGFGAEFADFPPLSMPENTF